MPQLLIPAANCRTLLPTPCTFLWCMITCAHRRGSFPHRISLKYRGAGSPQSSPGTVPWEGFKAEQEPTLSGTWQQSPPPVAPPIRLKCPSSRAGHSSLKGRLCFLPERDKETNRAWRRSANNEAFPSRAFRRH